MAHLMAHLRRAWAGMANSIGRSRPSQVADARSR
jgi:hypothetical protein